MEPETGGQKGLYGSSVGENMARAAVAELVGTFVLVVTGISVATASLLDQPLVEPGFGSLGVALAFGLTLTAVVVALGHVSGAHVNPAVTLGLAAVGRFPWRFAPAYVAAQMAGATLAGLATWRLYGDAARTEANLAATYPRPDASIASSLLAEGIATFILVLIIVAVATDERVAPAAVGPAIGFALAAGVFIAGPITGGAVNPARALGPMIVAGKFTDAWIYIVGPILGAVTATVLYDQVIAKADAPD